MVCRMLYVVMLDWMGGNKVGAVYTIHKIYTQTNDKKVQYNSTGTKRGCAVNVNQDILGKMEVCIVVKR
jgi:hypothetical protein